MLHKKEMRTTSNQKYEITEISHEKYPFLHRIRALRDVSAEVRAGDLGGFVESESNLSFEPDDTAWIFDDAIACNDAYVDKGAVLRGEAVVCDNAYISMGAVLSGHARVEDNAYIRGAVLSASARASGFSMILNDNDTMGVPILSGHCAGDQREKPFCDPGFVPRRTGFSTASPFSPQETERL